MEWQIAGPIIGVLGIVVILVLYLLSNREKIEVRHTTMSVELLKKNGTINGIRIQYSFTLIYTKGTRNLYISETRLKFDKHPWEKLRPSFHIPLEIVYNETLPDFEPKWLELGKPLWLGGDWSFAARKGKVISQEECKRLENIAQVLWHRYKIGWKDTYGKTQYKTIHQLRDIEKSFKKAL